MDPKTYSDARVGDPLRTKYYCQVNDSKTMNVVMELTGSSQEIVQRLPLRYVLVIDVSGSMQQVVGNQQRTLLQRVQLFAELAVGKINENDWLSIVTFSSFYTIILPMTRMNAQNKRIARKKLQELEIEGGTNLECGLLGALEVINSAPRLLPGSRDCVILFTDGEPNEGELDAQRLIEKYRKMQSHIGDACIPVSAFTIGDYRPDLLIAISRHLGSESFYWLDDKEEFEADMLIPLFLR